MSWYPGAVAMELQPESDSQPAIVPTQFIMHSIIAPWTAERVYQYWRDSSNLESHFGLGYAGDLGQFIGTQTRADANYRANRRPDGTGAVSIETASNTSGTDPWTKQQMDKLVALGVWLHHEHGIPLRICRTWEDPGYGYHRLHPQWAVSGTSCPGDARVSQFLHDVFPRIVAEATVPAPSEPGVTVIKTKETANAIDVALTPGSWTGLAFGGADPAVLVDASAGQVNVISTLVHLSFEQAAADDASVSGMFYLTDPDGSNPSGYQETGPRTGGGGHQFVHGNRVPAGKHLRFKVKVTRPDIPGDPPEPDLTPLTLLHRTESTDYWEA